MDKKSIGLYVMSGLYTLAGIMHFVRPRIYVRIMPPWLPAPDFLVALSGGCEIVLGLLLLPLATRKVAAWLIILMLVAIFPANIQMAVNYHRAHSPGLWVAILRLPLQAVLVWWAWMYTR
jgi:uncharacterized membrane protein